MKIMLNRWLVYSKGDKDMQLYNFSRSVFKYSFFWVFFLILFTVNSTAQPVKVEAKLDTNTILIGDQLHLSLNVLQPKKAEVSYPNVEEAVSPEIEILEYLKSDTIHSSDEIQVNRRYRITSFDSGRVNISPLVFHYQYDGRKDSVKTQEIALNVRTVQVDSTKTFFDIKGPMDAPISWREVLPYILGLLGLAIVAFLVWYFIKKYKSRKTEYEPEKPKEPAHVIAFRELDKLKEEKLWQNDKIKLYYTRLADILRTYLWHRYDIKTLERTTDEILDSLKNSGFSNDELFNKIEQILKTADLVKFARMQPILEENSRNMENAYEFVNQTKLVQDTQEVEKDKDKDKEKDKEQKNSNLNEKES